MLNVKEGICETKYRRIRPLIPRFFSFNRFYFCLVYDGHHDVDSDCSWPFLPI